MEKKIEALRTFIKALDIRHLDIYNHLEDYQLKAIIESEDEKPFDALVSILEESTIFSEIYIMFYASAMQYLTENDITLYRAMEVAEDLGYTPKQLNSELLASLLAADIAREELKKKETEFNNFIENLNDGLE